MRRLAIVGVAIGVGVLVARALAHRLHPRLMAACERMFEQMPDSFPPKRMMRGIEEIRANSSQALALLEAREQATAAETAREASDCPGRNAAWQEVETEVAVVGAGPHERDLPLAVDGGRS